MQYKLYNHNPPHLYADNSYYAITSGTYKEIKYFNNDSKKEMLLEIIKEIFSLYKYELAGWVILDNHYHLLAKSNIGKDLPLIFRKAHSKSSVYLKKYLRTGKPVHSNLTPGVHQLADAKIWHNYWDSLIKDEASYYKRLNYIHHNPVKHGYVNKMEDYKFSSYNYYLQDKGLEWLNDLFETYPIIDYTDLGEI